MPAENKGEKNQFPSFFCVLLSELQFLRDESKSHLNNQLSLVLRQDLSSFKLLGSDPCVEISVGTLPSQILFQA